MEEKELQAKAQEAWETEYELAKKVTANPSDENQEAYKIAYQAYIQARDAYFEYALNKVAI